MGILNFQLNRVGAVGVIPAFVFFDTNNTVAEVSTAGYLNKFVAQGNVLSETDMAVVSTRATPNARSADVNLFNISYSNGDWSLTTNSTPLTLLNGQIYVGNASNVAVGVTMSGDVTINNSGVSAITAGAIINADVNAAAAIAYSKLAALTSGNIIVGSVGNVPTAVAMSGDATIIASGALTIASGAVTLAKLASGVAPAGVIKFMGQLTTVGGSATEAFTITGALAATDRAFVQIVNNGTGNVTVLEAVVTNNTLTITFSGNPGNDTVFNYQLIRAAS